MATLADRTNPAYRVIWSPQDGPQTWLLSCPVFEVFFGGARGGGKSDGMLGDFASHADEFGEDAIGLVIRRELTQLKELIERSKQIYGPIGAIWHVGEKMWRFPNGARLTFAYIDNDDDADKYQGNSYSRIYVEELGNFPSPVPIFKLMACIRSANPAVRCGFRATGNPGGPGHLWIKQRYIMPAPRGMTVIKSKFINPFTKEEFQQERVFIPSKVTDNKYNNNPQYIARLQMVGNARLVEAWLLGNWDIIEGAYFDEWNERRHVISQFIIPAHWTRFTSMDWGSARPFSVGWWAMVPDKFEPLTQNRPSEYDPRYAYQNNLPRGALVRYREWYGCQVDENGVSMHNNIGLKLTVEQLASGIAEREKREPKNDQDRPRISLRVADPSIFKEDGGPSIGERMAVEPYYQFWTPADNTRVGRKGAMGGWDLVRSRLIGQDGEPMIYFFPNCVDSIRTLPALQHDKDNIEDVDTDGEDHCFAGNTMVATVNGSCRIDSLPAAGFVWDAEGRLRPYKNPRMTRRNAALLCLKFDDGTGIFCTPDHRFIVQDGRWVEARAMLNEVSYAYILPSWMNQSLSARHAKNFLVSVIINADHIFRRMGSAFIELFGKLSTDQSLAALTFITTISTKTTIGQRTSFASIQSSTWPIMGESGLAILPPHWKSMRGRVPLNGTVQRSAANGTKNNTKSIVATSFIRRWSAFARIAVQHLLGQLKRICSVQMLVSLTPAESLASIMNFERVSSAGKLLRLVGTRKQHHARARADGLSRHERGPICVSVSHVGRSDVYCLTVDEAGTFLLANGMAVSNCPDDVRYMCSARPYSRPEGSPEKGRIMTVGPDNQLTIKDAMGDLEAPREAKFKPYKRI